jgi:hypothetical protein
MSGAAVRSPRPRTRCSVRDRPALLIDLLLCAVPAVATVVLLVLALRG